MRRILVIVAATALMVASLPSVASAHRSTRESDTNTQVSCDLIGNEQGTIIFNAVVSDLYGSGAWMTYWELPALPDEAPPTWYAWEGQATLSDDGLQLSATLDMYEYVEEPMPEEPVIQAVPPPDPGQFVGQATVDVSFTPVGEPEAYSYESSGTNFRYRVEGTVQELAVSGEALLPGDLAFDLSTCTALTETYSFFATNPDAFVGRSEGISVGCYWEGIDYTVWLGAYRDGPWTGVDLSISDLTGEYYGYTGEAVVTSSEVYAAFEIFEPGEPEPEPEGIGTQAVAEPDEPVGSAVIQATLQPTGEQTRFSQRFGWEKYRATVEQLAVAGTLQVTWPGGDITLALDEASCQAESYRSMQQSPSPNGKPPVKAVPNDLPENALPIAVGETDSIRNTAGTSPEPEAPCTIIDPEWGEPVEVPITYTAWWMLEGTGAEVTVDTAGSSFDTVAAVYLADGEGFAQVACVDDVFTDDMATLQASVTFATEAGLTYYLQVGGYGYSSGQLELAVR